MCLRGSLAARLESVNQSGLLGQLSRGKASLQEIIAAEDTLILGTVV
jgi:hypothetical protein